MTIDIVNTRFMIAPEWLLCLLE